MPQTFEIGLKALITNSDRKVLLLKATRGETSYWDLPGGRMEMHETIADALHRELTEELPSIKDIRIHNLVDACKLPFTLKNNNGLMLLIYNVTANLSNVQLSSEHTQYQWVSKEEAPLLEQEATILPAYQEIIQATL